MILDDSKINTKISDNGIETMVFSKYKELLEIDEIANRILAMI